MKALTVNQEIAVVPTMTSTSVVWQMNYRDLFVAMLAVAVSAVIWLGLPELSTHARIAFITFALAVIGWVGTDIDDTYIALAAALVFSATRGGRRCSSMPRNWRSRRTKTARSFPARSRATNGTCWSSARWSSCCGRANRCTASTTPSSPSSARWP